jgi:hypothetical protein
MCSVPYTYLTKYCTTNEFYTVVKSCVLNLVSFVFEQLTYLCYKDQQDALFSLNLFQ